MSDREEFKLSKRKYKKTEVQAILDDLMRLHNEKENDLLAEIRELKNKNKNLEAEVKVYKDKEEEIVLSVKSAAKYALEQKKETDFRYKAAAETIKNFLEKWKAYFETLSEKYPLYPSTAKAIKLKKELEKIVKEGKTDKELVTEADELLNAEEMCAESFNPQKKINDYIAATENGGFNLNEVLNPGKLELEDLCKELGLIEENS